MEDYSDDTGDRRLRMSPEQHTDGSSNDSWDDDLVTRRRGRASGHGRVDGAGDGGGDGLGQEDVEDDEGTSNDSAFVRLPRDKQRRTTHYDYASEKRMTHTEAKLFYQRSQKESSSSSAAYLDGISPILRARTFPNNFGVRVGTMNGSGNRASERADLGEETYRANANDASLAYPDVPGDHTVADAAQQYVPSTHDGAQSEDPFLQADIAARSHAEHPGLPHESKPQLLVNEGLHGAGAGIGLGKSLGGFVDNDSHVTSELREIYTNIQKILNLRHKYMRLSLQRTGDNPKDHANWRVHPPPPEPSWQHAEEGPGRSATGGNSLADSGVLPTLSLKDETGDVQPSGSSMGLQGPPSPSRKRKPGQNVGADFDMADFYPLPQPDHVTFHLDGNSVYQIFEDDHASESDHPIVQIPTIKEFYMNLDELLDISSDGPSKSFAFRRLQYLDGKFHLYQLINEYQEIADSKRVPHRDFYNVRKVDTHVHHSACMNQKHLLRFIKSKMKKCPDEIVMYRDEKHLTLREVFESINLSAYDLSIDTLDMHAHTDSFHRFDKFNLKYNPVGESRLRTIFLKTDNFINGRYLAEITKEVISDIESSKYQMVEWRISIYGRSPEEWDKLAAWVVDNKLFSHNLRWLIQVPRLYDVYKASGLMENFEQVIVNLFRPLFEVTKDPSSHPKLHVFLQRVIGFDSVDDESKQERRLYKKFPLPKAWNTKQNPPYSYWVYYLWSNMASLNAWRKRRNLNTFLLRPHCGEAGDTDHLAAAALCCHSISHGLLLRKVPLVQYIFYLDQIGVAMSPLSNNALFLAYDRNPFLSYFKRGLNVSLSTDDPLQFAFTKEPLIEEYSVAAQIYKLSAVDMCELAKNSVVQSGFEHGIKQRWLGADFELPGVQGNTVAKTNVPNIRIAHRHETLLQELDMIARYSTIPGDTAATPNPSTACTWNIQAQHSSSPTSSTHTGPAGLDSSVHQSNAFQNTAGGQQVTPHPTMSSVPMDQSGIPISLSTTDMNILGSTSAAREGLPAHRHRAATMTNLTWPRDDVRHHSISGAEPRMFPGIVTRSARKDSMRQGSQSERDEEREGAGLTRRSTREKREPLDAVNGVVVKEEEEGDNDDDDGDTARNEARLQMSL